MTKPIVICKNLCKFYGTGTTQVEALRGVNLEIFPGEIRLLMGPSGSGKTTLVSVIAGILTQNKGECLVYDVPINQLPDRKKTQFRAKNVGFVFQIFNLIPMLTCEENISIPLILNGMNRKEAIEQSRHMMNELGLEDKIGSYPVQLSGGQQQRVAIGRALIHHPPLVVCDEPTSFLDHVTGNKIMELIRSMAIHKKITIIVVTHDPRITKFADNIDQLEDGRITNSTQ